jgi:hypothetical protein
MANSKRSASSKARKTKPAARDGDANNRKAGGAVRAAGSSAKTRSAASVGKQKKSAKAAVSKSAPKKAPAKPKKAAAKAS